MWNITVIISLISISYILNFNYLLFFNKKLGPNCDHLIGTYERL